MVTSCTWRQERLNQPGPVLGTAASGEREKLLGCTARTAVPAARAVTRAGVHSGQLP